jgi:hypothetical protein
MHRLKNHFTRWSELEIEKLIEVIELCLPVSRICDLLGRSFEDVEYKIDELSISPQNQTL